MQDPRQLSNRGPRKPGRPSSSEAASAPPAQPVTPAVVRQVDVLQGMVGPCCGQPMVPTVRRTVGTTRYLRCSKCAAYLVEDLVAKTIRVV